MIKFCELYEMNARWHPSKTLTMCVGLEFKELLTAKRAYEKYGNYLVINFENDWVILKEEVVKKMIKAAIMYSKGNNTVTIEASARTLFALLDELQQVHREYVRDGYKFRAASIMRICEREN